MEVFVRYLGRDKKTGILRYRRTYPPALRPYIGEPGSMPRELKVTLAAREITEPGAAERFEQAALRFAGIVARAKKMAAGQFDILDSPMIEFFVETYKSRKLAEDAEARLDPDVKARGELVTEATKEAGHALPEVRASAKWSQGFRVAIEAALGVYRNLSADGDVEGLVWAWSEEAEALTSSRGYLLDHTGRSFRDLCIRLNETAIAVHEAELGRMTGKIIPTPPLPSPPAAVDPVMVRGASFASIVRELLDSPSQTYSEATKAQTKTALRYLQDALGDPLPHDLSRTQVTKFLDLVARKPARVPAKERALPLEELLDRYEGVDVERVSPRTLEKHCRVLGARWREAQIAGPIDQGLSNPFTLRKFNKLKAKERRATGFSDDELQAIFSLPFFQGGPQPRWGRGETAYWLPLLALYTGARPEELVQLVVADFAQSGPEGRWMIDLQAERIHPEKGRQQLKTDNKESGQRVFPVPLPLVSLGLPRYLEWLTKRGEVALFPQLRLRNKFSYLYASFGERWREHIYAQGILTAGTGRQPMREFRHTWATAARTSGIARDAREYIQGRKDRGFATTDDLYGHFEGLASQIDLLAFPVDVLTLVKPWSVPPS